jgi:hypothetical protein
MSKQWCDDLMEEEEEEEEDVDGPVWEGMPVHSPVGSESGDDVSDELS